MLEIGDRLLSSFGQDVLDAVYYTSIKPKDEKPESSDQGHPTWKNVTNSAPWIVLAMIYIWLHSTPE